MSVLLTQAIGVLGMMSLTPLVKLLMPCLTNSDTIRSEMLLQLALKSRHKSA